eukprot:scaffold159893_cov40-Cyclotella_meneghiniana.AAC.2
MAMDRSTIWPYFPRFLIARPQFLRFWRACTAFITQTLEDDQEDDNAEATNQADQANIDMD